MHYIFYIILLGLVSFNAGAASASIITGPDALVQWKGGRGVNRQAMSKKHLFSGNESVVVRDILMEKYVTFDVSPNVSVTRNDYYELLLRLAKQADTGSLSAEDMMDNPELRQLFISQYINGCILLNLYKLNFDELTRNVLGEMGVYFDVQGPDRESRFNTALEKARHKFIGSPYKQLHSALAVAHEALSGNKLPKSSAVWEFFLPVLRAELAYLTRTLDKKDDMKQYIYYVTNLIQHITAGKHDTIDVSGKNVMGTTNPSHIDFLRTLTDSGSAAYTMRLKLVSARVNPALGSMNLSGKVDDSFVKVLRNHLHDFFPVNDKKQAQHQSVEHEKIIFNHRLNAFIVFALGAYDTYSKTIIEHKTTTIITDKYEAIQGNIIKAIDDLTRSKVPNFEIWSDLQVPVKKFNVASEVLDKITRTLSSKLIQAVDELYVMPLPEEKEEKEESRGELGKQKLLTDQASSAQRASDMTPTLRVPDVSHVFAPQDAPSAPQAPAAPTAPPVPLAPAVPTAPAALPQRAMPSVQEQMANKSNINAAGPQRQVAAKPSFLKDIDSSVMNKLKKITPQAASTGAKPQAVLSGGVMTSLFNNPKLEALRDANKEEDDGDNDWDGDDD